MHDILYHDAVLEDGLDSFFFVGEIKACGLNDFVRQGLERRFGRSFSPFSIVPDVLDAYDVGNILVINHKAGPLAERMGRRTAVRIPMSHFCAHASSNRAVAALLDEVSHKQDRIFIWMFESRVEMSLTDRPGVELLGPDPELVLTLNDKTWQYETFSKQLKVAQFRICCGKDEMLGACAELRKSCSDGIFVSCDYSAGGAASMVIAHEDEAACRFEDTGGRYLVSQYIPHVADPTVLAVVAGPDEVFVAGVADMRIEEGNKFRGSTYPSCLPQDLQARLRQEAVTVGKTLAKLGFRGIYGCDFIVDEDGEIYFIEVNPRKQGTTMEFCCALEHLLPQGAPNLLELELAAVLDGTFPDNTVTPDYAQAIAGDLHWGTYNHKVEEHVLTVDTLPRMPQPMGERELFQRVASGGDGGHVILEHVGAGAAVRSGTFLGRTAAVDSTREAMLARLDEAMRQLADSVAPR